MRREQAVDVLLVSLGSTEGLRRADDELQDSLRRAGARVAVARPFPQDALPTMMLTDLLWARAAREAASKILEQQKRSPARSVIYSTTTAAMFWKRPGAIRFDATAEGNRPGRHGLWQRPLERRRLREAPLLLPWSEGALREVACVSGALERRARARAAGARRGFRAAGRAARHRGDHVRREPDEEGARPCARRMAARSRRAQRG